MRPTGKNLQCKSGPNIEGLVTLDSIYSDGRDQPGDGQRGCCHPTVGLLLSENSTTQVAGRTSFFLFKPRLGVTWGPVTSTAQLNDHTYWLRCCASKRRTLPDTVCITVNPFTTTTCCYVFET